MTRPLARRFSVAPMMDCTDRHARYLLRLLSARALLYTEMITSGALLHGDARRHLRFNREEHPVAIQLGGADPAQMAVCARMAADEGYDEVNINVGCPSDRVQSGRFGACLMAEPQLVADCVAAMWAAVTIPVTVKTRIGIDRDESTDRLYAIVEACRAAGCATFIIHARKAWLDGLSPKENRELPPLRYEVVHALKRANPGIQIIINGGLTTIAQCTRELQHVDGVMLGREAYHNPYLLASVDRDLYGESGQPPTRDEVAARFIDYVARECSIGTPLPAMTRHLLGLYQGMAGARLWRRVLSEEVRRSGAGPAVILDAMRAMHAASRRTEMLAAD